MARWSLAWVAAVVCIPACGDSSPTATADPPAEWIAEHAHTISIDPADESFADLEPFRQAIGSARLVMLGEQSHGDGTTFLAKTRLIKFLHQEMGFDVLAFESGLYDVKKVWELIEAGEPAGSAMPRGIFSIWTGSAEVLPLTAYIEAEAQSARPLRLAGFDSQLTGSASEDFLVEDLTAFLTQRGSKAVEDPGWDASAAMLQTFASNAWWQTRPTEEEKDAVAGFLQDLLTEIEGFQPDTAGAFWTQMLESLQEEVKHTWSYEPGAWRLDVSSIRDRQMGRNLLWLLEHGFPGSKVIVWAATLHVARHVEDLEIVGSSLTYDGYTTMGQVVWDGIGSNAYAVGFTAGGGQVGRWFDAPRGVDAPRSGSLEDVFERGGFTNAFLDFRTIAAGGEWLEGDLLSRPMGYAYMRARWPNHLDGMVYTQTMHPSTPRN
jgi:erythromycin esterase